MPALRSLTREDATEVLSMNVAARPHVAPLDAAELARLQALSNDHVVIQDDSGALLGYALIFVSTDDYDGEEFERFRTALPAPFTYIDQVVVHASARGYGIGRQLYDGVAKTAFARGHRWLCCEVNTLPPNPGSLAFHRRCGFVAFGDLSTQDGRLVTLMTRRLSKTEDMER